MWKRDKDILTAEKVDAAPELTVEDVAREDAKILAGALKVMSGVIDKAKEDPGAPLEPDALAAAIKVQRASPAEWERVRRALQEQGAPLRALDKELRKAGMHVLEGGRQAATTPGAGIYRELAAGVRRGHVRRSRRDVYGGFRLLPTSAGEV